MISQKGNYIRDPFTRKDRSILGRYKIDDESISILLYADDVVHLAENETDLQCMLNVLGNWCNTNKLFINSSKSNISTSGIPQKQNPTSPSKSMMRLSNMPRTTNIWV